MLTPRIVRVLDLTEEDLRAFQMGRDSGASAPGPVCLGHAASAARELRPAPAAPSGAAFAAEPVKPLLPPHPAATAAPAPGGTRPPLRERPTPRRRRRP